ncbi:hypothetical protein AGMMS50218_16960 [Actinomycetota bacterium]|nr:hypothetical protein AGMMS50218_16960 [Actinomycetota bacterium]
MRQHSARDRSLHLIDDHATVVTVVAVHLVQDDLTIRCTCHAAVAPDLPQGSFGRADDLRPAPEVGPETDRMEAVLMLE